MGYIVAKNEALSPEGADDTEIGVVEYVEVEGVESVLISTCCDTIVLTVAYDMGVVRKDSTDPGAANLLVRNCMSSLSFTSAHLE